MLPTVMKVRLASWSQCYSSSQLTWCSQSFYFWLFGIVFGQCLVHGLSTLKRMEFSTRALEWNVESGAEETQAAAKMWLPVFPLGL